jgi:sugar phosphate isomerase/epimerase
LEQTLIRSAITISLFPEARSGPFVLSDGLAEGCSLARELGFDAVELFPPYAGELDPEVVKPLLEKHNLKLAAVGSGAGWLRHQYTLTNFDRAKRDQGMEFIRQMIDAAGALGAPVIIGSMQGRWGNGVEREEAFYYLGHALTGLSNYAFEKYGVPLIYEPLNRYETNMCNTVAQGVELITSQSLKHVVLLADLFHMNIEEADLAASLVAGGAHIGHVHFADSNRRPIGSGHTVIPPIVDALRQISYDGCVSAECFPQPDPRTAAQMTIDAFRKFFR